MSIRCKINDKTRQATVSGINYRDLRSLVDAASIHYYDMQKKSKRSTDQLAFAKRMICIAKMLDDAILVGILATHPKRPAPPPTVEERKAKLRESKLLEALVEMAIHGK